jgi:hypothetical protein
MIPTVHRSSPSLPGKQRVSLRSSRTRTGSSDRFLGLPGRNAPGEIAHPLNRRAFAPARQDTPTVNGGAAAEQRSTDAAAAPMILYLPVELHTERAPVARLAEALTNRGALAVRIEESKLGYPIHRWTARLRLGPLVAVPCCSGHAGGRGWGRDRYTWDAGLLAARRAHRLRVCAGSRECC